MTNIAHPVPFSFCVYFDMTAQGIFSRKFVVTHISHEIPLTRMCFEVVAQCEFLITHIFKLLLKPLLDVNFLSYPLHYCAPYLKLKLHFRMNFWSHTLHTKFLSPVCVFKFRLKTLLNMNFLSHRLQTKSLSPISIYVFK